MNNFNIPVHDMGGATIDLSNKKYKYKFWFTKKFKNGKISKVITRIYKAYNYSDAYSEFMLDNRKHLVHLNKVTFQLLNGNWIER